MQLYLIPGLAADGRSFQDLAFDPGLEVQVLEHLVPEPGELFPAYARRMAARIDTTRPFALLGVSLGGMVAVEMTEFLDPAQVFLVASAKGRHELPYRYRLQKYLPLYRLFEGTFYQRATNWVRPIFEPDSRPFDALSRQMLADKHPDFMDRALHMIMYWERQAAPPDIIHLHGSKDHTLPIRHVTPTERVPGGSHMMIMTCADLVSERVNTWFRGQ